MHLRDGLNKILLYCAILSSEFYYHGVLNVRLGSPFYHYSMNSLQFNLRLATDKRKLSLQWLAKAYINKEMG